MLVHLSAARAAQDADQTHSRARTALEAVTKARGRAMQGAGEDHLRELCELRAPLAAAVEAALTQLEMTARFDVQFSDECDALARELSVPVPPFGVARPLARRLVGSLRPLLHVEVSVPIVTQGPLDEQDRQLTEQLRAKLAEREPAPDVV